MKKKDLKKLLSDHADALNGGQTGWDMLDRRLTDENIELASLFQLAEEIKAALIPVPVPAFRDQLRRQLENYEPAKVTIGTSSTGRKQKLIFVAMAGSTLSVVGIFVVLLRRLRSTTDEAGQPATIAA